jgi:hypothetical protein
MNFRGFHSSIFEVFEKEFHVFLTKEWNTKWSEFFITVPPHQFVQSPEKSCKVMISADKRYGVTYAEDKQSTQGAIRELVNAWVYPEHLWE